VRGRHRDRRGRGLRGPLAPAELPVTRSRSEQFDELVLDAVERLERRWAEELRSVELAVEDVPPEGAGGPGGGAPGAGAAGRSAGRPVPMGRAYPARAGRPARVVVYRRPIEARAGGQRALARLVHDVVVEQVADLLGTEPDAVDPDYGPDAD
jgi:predicted Zn-dependent protease with MMP-like domain